MSNKRQEAKLYKTPEGLQQSRRLNFERRICLCQTFDHNNTMSHPVDIQGQSHSATSTFHKNPTTVRKKLNTITIAMIKNGCDFIQATCTLNIFPQQMISNITWLQKKLTCSKTMNVKPWTVIFFPPYSDLLAQNNLSQYIVLVTAIIFTVLCGTHKNFQFEKHKRQHSPNLFMRYL